MKYDEVKLAVIGLGGRGIGLMHCLLGMHDVQIVAVCDNYQDRVDDGAKLVKSKRGNMPVKSTDYHDVIGLDEVNCVFISCAWEDHIPIAIEAMKLNKFVACEVGGAYKLQDCFDLVQAHEETGAHCMMLENCCYGKYELMCMEMAKKGVFGEIVHVEGGYCHDLRHEISDGEKNRHYRFRNYVARNCENYPTHELGPLAKLIHVYDGNKLNRLTSYSSKSVGLHDFILRKRSDNPKLVEQKFAQGDVVTTVIQCENGETIVLSLDTTLPRTYSRHYTVRGTHGAYFEDSNSVFVDGTHNVFDFVPKALWNNGKKYAKKYAHALWNKRNKDAMKAGHGGMDYFVLRAMVETVKAGAYPPIDTYDTALWMSITALSEQSIKQGNVPMEIPDFTKGHWQKGARDMDVLKLYDLRY